MRGNVSFGKKPANFKLFRRKYRVVNVEYGALCWDGVVTDPFLWRGLEWVGELEGGWGGWGVGRGLEWVDGEVGP